MTKEISFVADDFGLTKGITDTILEVVDNGPITLVSIIPNGEAVAYAIDEYKKRSEHLTLAVHLNLTEGKSLSSPQSIPHLVDARGMFMHSVAGLWSAYLLGTRAKRAMLRAEVRTEIVAQLSSIRTVLGTGALAVNGHQHVHLIPFVFDALVTLPDIASIRTVREPFQWRWSPTALFAYSVLTSFSWRAARIARSHGIATNDAFIGFLYSGHMTEKTLRTGITRAHGSVEALLHPGSATDGELASWQGSRADLKWHYSPWRTNERETLLNWGK